MSVGISVDIVERCVNEPFRFNFGNIEFSLDRAKFKIENPVIRLENFGCVAELLICSFYVVKRRDNFKYRVTGAS